MKNVILRELEVLGVKRKTSLSIVINAVSFDYIISNVKSQIVFLKYRIVRQKKKRYYTFNPSFFGVLWIYQKCHYDLRLPRIVAAFITQLVGVPRS